MLKESALKVCFSNNISSFTQYHLTESLSIIIGPDKKKKVLFLLDFSLKFQCYFNSYCLTSLQFYTILDMSEGLVFLHVDNPGGKTQYSEVLLFEFVIFSGIQDIF